MNEEIVSLWPNPITKPSAIIVAFIDRWKWKPYSGHTVEQAAAAQPIVDEILKELNGLAAVLSTLENAKP